jgi:hypothetical protein
MTYFDLLIIHMNKIKRGDKSTYNWYLVTKPTQTLF